jgi:hypothetical protein
METGLVLVILLKKAALHKRLLSPRTLTTYMMFRVEDPAKVGLIAVPVAHLLNLTVRLRPRVRAVVREMFVPVQPLMIAVDNPFAPARSIAPPVVQVPESHALLPIVALVVLYVILMVAGTSVHIPPTPRRP